MCGIIGYIGKRKIAVPVLLEGLYNLEYRGYDSAGIAVVTGKSVDVIKSKGSIINLEAKLSKSLESSVGIGHTRWATHGESNEINSHPHRVGKITVVHNGIIENYLEIKKELSTRGIEFISETDTEVAAALLDSLYSKFKDMHETIKEFQKIVRGSYAIAVLLDDNLDEIYLIKNLSPIVIGVGKGENYLASDIHAILKRTKRYVVLDDGDYAIVSANDVQLFDDKGDVKLCEIRIYDKDVNETDKGNYEHFMLKEIHEQPDVMRRLISKYIKNIENASLSDLKRYKSVTILGCGSAMHAGLVGKYLLEKYVEIPVNVEIASEFRYKKTFVGKDDLVVAISQSGETADTLAAIKKANDCGASTLGIVNVEESSIAREVDEVIYTLAGNEVAVATTKAYFAQCIIFWLLAFKDRLNPEIEKELAQLSIDIEKLIENDNIYRQIAERIYKFEDIFFIGRQIDYALCLEGSLKLKEISYIHSEAYAAGELKHGTISLIDKGTPVIAVLTDELIAKKTISNIKEVASRGAFVIMIVSDNIDVDVKDYSNITIKLPFYRSNLSSLLCIIPLQMIAYEVAKMRGCTIDKPRNLAKSVTVE